MSQSTEVMVTVNFTTCSGVKCYYGKCDGQQKVCVCNEGYFGPHCEYAYSTAFWVCLFNLVNSLADSHHRCDPSDNHPYLAMVDESKESKLQTAG